MHKIIYLLVVAFLTLGSALATAQTEDKKQTITLTPSGEAKMVLLETEFDFGEIKQGEQVTHVFTFVNEGSAPLVIEKVTTPCGCTAPKWPKEPIAPGATGEIQVKFNSVGKMGNQVKNLSVIYNSETSPEFIVIKGKVKPNPAAN